MKLLVCIVRDSSHRIDAPQVKGCVAQALKNSLPRLVYRYHATLPDTNCDVCMDFDVQHFVVHQVLEKARQSHDCSCVMAAKTSR